MNVFVLMSAATPSKLREVTGNVTEVYTADINESFVSVDWLPPADNENETAIDYYELTMGGSTDTRITTFKGDASVSLPYKFVVPVGNFTTISVTAVDKCGQRSEPSESFLSISSDSSPTPGTCNTNMEEQLQDTVTTLASTIAIGISLCIAVLITAVPIIIILRAHKKQAKYSVRVEVDSKGVQTHDAI